MLERLALSGWASYTTSSICTRPGRLNKNRRKDPSEEPKSGKKKLSNKGNRVACTRCKQFGHNVRTCKKPAPQQESAPEPPPNRKAGRPRKPPIAAQEPGARNQRRKELKQARKRYGVLTSDSGTIYIRPPGARRTTVYRQHEVKMQVKVLKWSTGVHRQFRRYFTWMLPLLNSFCRMTIIPFCSMNIKPCIHSI